MKRLLYIYNPAAGRKSAKINLSDVVEIFARQGYEVTVHPTQRRGDATATAARQGAGPGGRGAALRVGTVSAVSR